MDVAIIHKIRVNDTDAHPFLLPELAWIAVALERQLPTLGVCLGAQLLAEWFRRPDLNLQIGDQADPQAIRAAAPQQFPMMNALSGRLLSRFALLCGGRIAPES